LMRMGNNQVFHIKVHLDKVEGKHVFQFEHPTRPGWMRDGVFICVSNSMQSCLCHMFMYPLIFHVFLSTLHTSIYRPLLMHFHTQRWSIHTLSIDRVPSTTPH
jgi:hypothetical protein